MRLFTAILFDNDIEDKLQDSIERLRQSTEKGTFTNKDNLHLTVNFIGETERLEDIKQAMKLAVIKTDTTQFQLTLGGVGKFKRREGDIYWIGVIHEPSMWSLQKDLVKELKEARFSDIEDKEYTPHITLARKVICKQDFRMKEFEEKTTPIMTPVKKLSLMKSERVQGKLIYTEIFNIELSEKRDVNFTERD